MHFKSVAIMIAATAGIPAVAGDANPHVVDLNMNCGIANDIGRRAYVRAQNSQAAGDNWTAFAHANAFWDIEQYSLHCPEIVHLAKELNGTRLGKGEQAPDRGEVEVDWKAVGKCLEKPRIDKKQEAANPGTQAKPDRQ